MGRSDFEVTINHSPGYGPFEPEERAAVISVQCAEERVSRLQSLRIPTAFLSPDIVVLSLQSLVIGGLFVSRLQRGHEDAPCHERHQGNSANMSRPAASQGARCDTLDTLLGSLARCPSLLNLQCLWGSELLVHPLELSTLRPVSLPLLNKIKFQKYCPEPLSDILRHLILPPIAALKIDLEVVVNETRCTARGYGADGQERLSLITSTVAHSALLDELLHLFAPAASPFVTRLALGFKSAARMYAMLAAFPRLTYLRMARKRHHMFHALAAASVLPCAALAHPVMKRSVGRAYEEFRLAYDIAEKALERRAQRSLRLQRLEMTFRRPYGIELEKVDLKTVRSGVVALFAPYADEVVIELEPDRQKSTSSGSGLAGSPRRTP